MPVSFYFFVIGFAGFHFSIKGSRAIWSTRSRRINETEWKWLGLMEEVWSVCGVLILSRPTASVTKADYAHSPAGGTSSVAPEQWTDALMEGEQVGPHWLVHTERLRWSWMQRVHPTALLVLIHTSDTSVGVDSSIHQSLSMMNDKRC